jgi:hypothetical protein
LSQSWFRVFLDFFPTSHPIPPSRSVLRFRRRRHLLRNLSITAPKRAVGSPFLHDLLRRIFRQDVYLRKRFARVGCLMARDVGFTCLYLRDAVVWGWALRV